MSGKRGVLFSTISQERVGQRVPSLGPGYRWPVNRTDCPACGGEGELMIAVRKPVRPYICYFCLGAGTWVGYERLRLQRQRERA